MFFKHSVKFLLHKRKPGDTTALAIRMRVTLKGQRPVDFPTGRKVDLAFWDEAAERVIEGKTPQNRKMASEANRTIEEYKAQINEVLARYELLEKRVPTTYELKELFNDIIGRKPIFEKEEATLEKAFEEYIKTVGTQNTWSKTTYCKHNTIKKHLLGVANNIPLSQVTPDFLQSFIDSLLNKRGMRNTSVLDNYQFVRWFLRWARKNGYYSGNADEIFRPRLKGTDGNQKEVIYLTVEELHQIAACEIPQQNSYLEPVRDIFLFCCFTSLRYSDVKALRKADIINGNAIRVVTHKTMDGLIIELNNRARAILKKYDDYQDRNGGVFPVKRIKEYNEYLKELGRLAKLDAQTRVVYYRGSKRYDEFYPKHQLLTSHVARRTFVVTALQLGIPVEVIMRWTGHSSYDALKPYVAIVDQLKKAEMDKFNTL